MLTKVVPVGSWPGLSEDGVFTRSIPVLKSGELATNDRKLFTKQSGTTSEFMAKFANLKIHPGELPLHMIALGATEGWGNNRNGDGFTERTCLDHHDSFVKKALYYMSHINRDRSRSYGVVKMSHYNRPMRRVELLVLANLTKDAARKNGGLVVPEKIAEALLAGKDRADSMSCTLPHDVCVNCRKQARHRGEYCTADTCINPDTGHRGFGCRTGLCKIAEDGFIQYVDNPNPTWFDISDVDPNPADPIAYGSTVPSHYFSKAASTGEAPCRGGAELAEIFAGIYAPSALSLDLTGTAVEVQAQQSWATKIAQACLTPAVEQTLAFAAGCYANTAVNWKQALDRPGSPAAQARLRKLAQAQVGLSLADLAQWLGVNPGVVKAAARILQNSEAWLAVSDSLDDLARNPYWDRNQQTLHDLPCAAKYLQSRSLEKTAVRSRIVWAASQSSVTEKRAETNAAVDHRGAAELAHNFAHYKLAALAMLDQQLTQPEVVSRLVNLTVAQIAAECR